MAKRSKKKKRQQHDRPKKAAPAEAPASDGTPSAPVGDKPALAAERSAPDESADEIGAAKGADEIGAAKGASWAKKMAIVLVIIGAAAATAITFARRVKVVELKTPSGEMERCASCHPDGKSGDKAHPPIKGHEAISKFGCTPCHGGVRRSLDKVRAHVTLPSAKDQAFLPRPFFAAGCAHCHIIGDLVGAEALAAGQREYVAAGCVGCHAPGRRTVGVGVDLKTRPPRTIADLRRRMVDPRKVLPDSKMWSLRDRTYRLRYAATPVGEKRLQQIVTYVLALIRRPASYRTAWAKKASEIKADCTRCHLMDKKGAASGEKHRCVFLAKQSNLRCQRCHETSAAKKGGKRSCPQIRAFAPLCGTCHLRGDEGIDKLLQ